MKPNDLEDLRMEAWNRVTAGGQGIFADGDPARADGERQLALAHAQILLAISGELALIRQALERKA